jgi:hypothetical protein
MLPAVIEILREWRRGQGPFVSRRNRIETPRWMGSGDRIPAAERGEFGIKPLRFFADVV